MSESLNELERWNGGFPGEHEYSALDGLDKSPDNLELEVFFDAAQKLIENWRGNKFAGLYLYGTPGTGKTHAAIGLGRELHEQGANVFYRYGPSLDIKKNTSEGWTGDNISVDPKGDNPVFPLKNSRSVGKALTDMARNPMHALIFDDYRPETQRHLHDAVDAAVQYGGLVVVTSNYTDPFKMLETPEPSQHEEEVVRGIIIDRLAPDEAEKLKVRRTDAAKQISDSLRSRIASGFKLIEFSGPDQRFERSFWD